MTTPEGGPAGAGSSAHSYGPRMTTPTPNTIGPTLQQLLDSVIFSDPATHPLREEWERTKAEEQAVFERVCEEQYQQRLKYHRICRTPDAEQEARREATLLRPMLREELDARLAERWAIVLRKVRAVLADRPSEPGESADSGSDDRSGDRSGT